MSESLDRLFKTALFRIVASALGFLTAVITSRYLGPDGRGVLALFMNTVITIVAFSGSFQASIVYFVGTKGEDHRPILRNLILVALLSAIASTLAVVIFAPLRPYLLALPIAVFFFSLVLYAEGLAYARDHLIRANLLKSLPSILSFVLIATFFFLFNRKEVPVAIWLWTLGFPLTLLLLRVRLPILGGFRSDIMKKLISHGAFVALSTFISRIFYRLDFFYLSKMKGDAIAGIYSVSMTVADINFLIFNMITTAFLGKMAGPDSRKYLKYGLAYTALLEIAYLLFLAAAGKPLIPLIFGHQFAPAFAPALILSLGILFYTLGSLIAIYINVYVGKTYIPFVIAVIGLAFKGIVAYLLIMEHGMAGGAISSLLSYTLTFILFVYAYFRAVKA